MSSLTKDTQMSCGAKGKDTWGMWDYNKWLDKTANALDGDVSKNTYLTQVIDGSFSARDMMGDIQTDFLYNIKLSWNGETRAPVLRDGKLFDSLEKSTIIPTLQQLINTCNLTDEKQWKIEEALKRNRDLRIYYQGVALGNEKIDESDDVKSAIYTAYNPTATAECVSDNPNEKTLSKKWDDLKSLWMFNENTLKDWKDAIALFRGDSPKRWGSYNDVSKKLLAAELSRQGFSKNAVQAATERLDCVRSKSPEDIFAVAKAGTECFNMTNFSFNADKFIKDYIVGKNGPPKTTNEYISQNELYKKLQNDSKSVMEVYQGISGKFSDTEVIDATILSNLIDLHTSLVLINDDIEKRIPKMSENCMKWNPSIKWACYPKK